METMKEIGPGLTQGSYPGRSGPGILKTRSGTIHA